MSIKPLGAAVALKGLSQGKSKKLKLDLTDEDGAVIAEWDSEFDSDIFGAILEELPKGSAISERIIEALEEF